jgi:hypothetical protein
VDDDVIILDRQQAQKNRKTCGIGGGTKLTSFRKIINMKTPIAVAQKLKQLPQISTYLMMAE